MDKTDKIKSKTKEIKDLFPIVKSRLKRLEKNIIESNLPINVSNNRLLLLNVKHLNSLIKELNLLKT